MSIQIPFAVVPIALSLSKDIQPMSKVLYTILSSHASSKDRTCFPGRRRLCLLLSCCDKSLSRYMEPLISSGWIDREQRRDDKGQFRGWIYTVHLEPRDSEGGSARPLPRKETDSARSEVPQKQEPTEPRPKETHTQQAVPVCVAPEARKESITPEIRAAIDRICEEAKPYNPGAYRRVLMRLAERGELELPKPATAGTDSSKFFREVDRWRDEAASRDEIKEIFSEFLRYTGPNITQIGDVNEHCLGSRDKESRSTGHNVPL